MATKHTPGPWKCGGHKGRIIYAPDGFAVGDATVFHGRNPDDTEHNARLMAAAPEMLAALERLEFAALCRDSTMGDPCRLLEAKAELSAAASEARAIIKRATEG